MITITNNLVHLTEEEKNLIDSALSYEYLYGVGVITLKTKVSAIWWDCTNSADAKDYLDSRKVKEFKVGVK
jgi:hypothetical protein